MYHMQSSHSGLQIPSVEECISIEDLFYLTYIFYSMESPENCFSLVIPLKEKAIKLSAEIRESKKKKKENNWRIWVPSPLHFSCRCIPIVPSSLRKMCPDFHIEKKQKKNSRSLSLSLSMTFPACFLKSRRDLSFGQPPSASGRKKKEMYREKTRHFCFVEECLDFLLVGRPSLCSSRKSRRCCRRQWM